MGSSYIGTPLLSQKVTDLEAALVTANAAIATNAGDTVALQTWASDRVKFVYPNGGSLGDERTISVNAKYTVLSPFNAGVKFSTIPEYFSINLQEWVQAKGAIYSSTTGGGYGVQAFPRSVAGVVVLVTANQYLGAESKDMASMEDNAVGLYYSDKKWRVRCVRED